MFQTNTTWMDGTVGVTQCPIPPGKSFTYNFTITEQRGTYWWHSHAQGQYTDGIVGPLIVHDPNEGFMNEYDEDIIVMISGNCHNIISFSLFRENFPYLPLLTPFFFLKLHPCTTRSQTGTTNYRLLVLPPTPTLRTQKAKNPSQKTALSMG